MTPEPRTGPELRDRLTGLLDDPGFQNEIAQVRSKATLLALGESLITPRWTYVANRFSRNCSAATLAIESVTLKSNSDIDLSVYARQLAIAWENLAKLNEGAERDISLLNAAMCFELSGYQANSACLARGLSSHSLANAEPNLKNLLAMLLQRRLLLVRRLAIQALKEPDSEFEDQLSLGLALGTAVTGDALSHLAGFLMTGDDVSYERANELLQEASTIFDTLRSPIEATLVYGLRSILPSIFANSTWKQFESMLNGSPRWNRYLKLLARGTGIDSRGVVELWPSQRAVLERGFLKSDESMLVRLPTSSGKTRVAELAIVDTLTRYPDSKCIYVAPYRSLVYEIEDSMGRLLGDLGYRMSSIVGSYESDQFEAFLLETANLLIVTPEKMDMVLRTAPEFFDNIRLIVLDEAHVVDDDSRGAKFEFLLTKLRQRFSQIRYLVMSAVVPEQTLRNFARWLSGNEENLVSSEWRPSIQRLTKFEWQGSTGVIRFGREPEIPGLESFVPGVISQQEYSFTNPNTGRANRRKFPLFDKKDTAAALAYQLADQGMVLVFCAQTNWAESVAKALLNAIDLRERTENVVAPFFNAKVPRPSAIAAREWLGEDHPVTQALNRGIAIHHGRIPEVVREALERDLRLNRYRVVVATNTLAQGVNLPVRTVIMHSCWRSEDSDNRQRISVRDYWNIAGRAGRAGMETEGMIIHLVLNRQDQRDFDHFSNKGNIEEVHGALFKMLRYLVNERMSDEAIAAVGGALDPEILSLLVEEGSEQLDIDYWDNFIGHGLVQIESERVGEDLSRLTQSITLQQGAS